MPSITGVNLPVDKFLVEGKKKMPNLVGTKFTHNNLMEMGACIDLEQHKFEVLHGFDEILIAGLSMEQWQVWEVHTIISLMSTMPFLSL